MTVASGVGLQPLSFGLLEQWLVGNDAVIRLVVASLLGGVIG